MHARRLRFAALSALAATCLLTRSIVADEPARPGRSGTGTQQPVVVPDSNEPQDPTAIPEESESWAESSESTGACCACEHCLAARSSRSSTVHTAAASAYAPLFFHNKFDYLSDPDYDDWHLGENWKRLCFGQHGVLDVGGQYRARVQNERNLRGLGITGADDDFLLHRTRLYLNGEFGDAVRVYAEMLDAESNYENLAPRPIEVNRSDLLNLFADARVHQFDRGDLWVRIGRQELLYGSQRLVSPLDWSNTRRNFDGVDVFFRGPEWNVDLFFTHPVTVHPEQFDSPDLNQDFAGMFSSYKGRPGQTVDLYYLHYRNASGALAPNGLYLETAGARWQGSQQSWLWDFEGAYQFGKNSDDSNHSAGFFTCGLGRKFDRCWQPTLWLYYDWSSGGSDRGARQGFDHLLPLAHRYHGFMDLYARSNLETPNLLLTVQPREKLQLLLWYHYFFLENKNDSPYNVNMSAFNGANAPASASLGHEIDVTAQWTISPRLDLLVGYSHFFAGDYYRLTPGLPFRGDADFYYTQLTVNF